MYTITTNDIVLTTCNSQAEAEGMARFWAGLRKETLYIYFKKEFFASINPNENEVN
jgi:hypothetical protein